MLRYRWLFAVATLAGIAVLFVFLSPGNAIRFGVVSGLLFVALALVRNLALVPVFLRHIEPHEFGAWMATGGVLAYLLMVDFGLMGVVAQRTAEAYGARDFPLLSRRIGTSLVVSTANLSFIHCWRVLLHSVASALLPGAT